MTNLINSLSQRPIRVAKFPKPTAQPPAKIGIVGGGLSGVLVAVHLLQEATTPLDIYLIDRQPKLGQGIAYRTERGCHLLNVPVGKMSLFPHQPDHFLKWLQQHSPRDADHVAFVSRHQYGKYVQSVLQDAIACSSIARLYCCTDNVVAIQPEQPQLVIKLESGKALPVDRVVLAIGNFPPRHLAIEDSHFYQSDRYVHSVWADERLSHLPSADPVLLIGSGLTAIDQVMTLQQQGHQGQIHLVSRRGLLPQAHRAVPAHSFCLPELRSRTVRSLLKSIRQEVDQAVAQGEDWRSVIDALRPQTQTLWQSLPLSEQRRFLRHVRPYWEVHRHRIAPSIAQTLAELRHTGQLQIHAGRIQSFWEDAGSVTVVIRKRGTMDLMQVRSSLVANCTGSECDYRQLRNPLIQQLLAAGMIHPDPLFLGLAVAGNGALIDRSGKPSQQFFTLGTPRKGKLWETTAVPEIRLQAAEMAKMLLAVAVK
ncbi:MAG TPA: FAD/NAD(P)-binding protein [Trichocoleus sp.]|jgi:uncharacterized NAD(P)/FAD-binding protein YdhS